MYLPMYLTPHSVLKNMEHLEHLLIAEFFTISSRRPCTHAEFFYQRGHLSTSRPLGQIDTFDTGGGRTTIETIGCWVLKHNLYREGYGVSTTRGGILMDFFE